MAFGSGGYRGPGGFDPPPLGGGPGSSGRPARRQGPRWQQALVATFGFVAVLYVVELFDVLTTYPFALEGIMPRSMDGLSGVVVAPLIHADWAHLMANSEIGRAHV